MRLTRWSVMLAVLAAMALVVPATVPTAAQNGPRPQVIPVVAQMTTGGGASYMHVEVNRQGNMGFVSPQGEALVFDGYALCEGDNDAYAYNLPIEEGGFAGLGPVTIKQAHPGAFPVTIVRNTQDGRIRLTQTWAVPDPTEKDVTVTVTVRNISASPISDQRLMRSGSAHYQFDDPNPPFFGDASTADSAFEWWDNDFNGVANGLVMYARTVGKPHLAGVTGDIDLARSCGGYNDMEGGAGMYAQIVYLLPTLAPGAEWTMSFGYRRL